MDDNRIIWLSKIHKSFDGEPVLRGIDLDIHDKEFVTLLGPSGCGKTTMLRILGGFITPDSGDVFFNGQRINNLPPYKRQLNTVFQRYALFPHLNVFENVAFGLRIAKMDDKEIRIRVGEMLEMVNLKGFERRGVEQLSGGQQQRVAIARALANHPKLLLLDEPLGALDLKLRKGMQIELKKIQQSLGITFVYVTHDQEEALTMSDTVVVMNNGKINQIGTPQDIYNEPTDAFVAGFIGESNTLDGIMLKDYLVEFAGVEFPCVDKGFLPRERIQVVVRPEDVKVVPDAEGQLAGMVESLIFKGVHYEMIVDVLGVKWKIHSTIPQQPGSYIGMHLDPEDIHIMKASQDDSIVMAPVPEETSNIEE